MGIDDCSAHFYLLLPDELKAAKMSGAPPKSIHVMRAINHAAPALFISDNNITGALLSSGDRPVASGVSAYLYIRTHTALSHYTRRVLSACVPADFQ